jgi:hypothetical protein
MCEKIEKLEQKLANMRAHHRDAWDMYGSELCAGEMIKKEEEFQKEIEDLRKKQH